MNGAGRAIARALAKAGANLVVTSPTYDKLADVASKVKEVGAWALPYAIDITRQYQVEQMVQAAQSD